MAGRRVEAGAEIAEGVGVFLKSRCRLGVHTVGLPQVRDPRRMHAQLCYKRGRGRQIELHVVSQTYEHGPPLDVGFEDKVVGYLRQGKRGKLTETAYDRRHTPGEGARVAPLAIKIHRTIIRTGKSTAKQLWNCHNGYTAH